MTTEIPDAAVQDTAVDDETLFVGNELEPFKDWSEWLARWKKCRFLQERLGLLHCALDFHNQSRSCDAAVRFFFGYLLWAKPSDDPKSSSYLKALQDKAEAVLLQTFFRRDGTDAPRGVVILGGSPGLVPLVLDTMAECVCFDTNVGRWRFSAERQKTKAGYVADFLSCCAQWLYMDEMGWPGSAWGLRNSLPLMRKQLFRLFLRYGLGSRCHGRVLRERGDEKLSDALMSAKMDLEELRQIAVGPDKANNVAQALLLPGYDERGVECRDAAREYALLSAMIEATEKEQQSPPDEPPSE